MKRYIRNRPLRILLWILLGLSLLLTISVVILKLYTREVIQQAISSQTDGKVNVVIGKVRLKVLPGPRVDLFDTYLSIQEQNSPNELYKIRFSYLGLQLRSLRAFLLERKVLIDFLVMENPRIEVNPHLREKKKEGNHAVHFELGNIYLALKKIATDMQIKRFGIINGSVVINKLSPGNTTIDIGGINFHASELFMKTTKSNLLQEQFEAGKIRISTGRQDIVFPEGNYRIRYSTLNVFTDRKLIEIDSMRLNGHSKDTSFGNMELGFSRLRIFNMDFWSLYDSNMVRIDSLICTDPRVNLNLDVTPKAHKQEKHHQVSVEKRIAGLVGKMKIGYIGFLNSDLALTTRKFGNYSNFRTNGNNFEINGLDIDSSRSNPVHVDNLVFAIKDYTAASTDGMYNFTFDSVVYRRKDLTLKNFRITPSQENKEPDKKYISIPEFELKDLSLGMLITDKKLLAAELVLRNPTTTNLYSTKPRSKASPRPLKDILRSVSNKIDIKKMRWENAYFLNRSVKDQSEKLVAGGVYSEIDLDDLFDASTYEVAGFSIGLVKFDSLLVHRGALNIDLRNGELRGKKKIISAGSIRVNNKSTGLNGFARNVRLSNYHLDDDLEEIAVDSISYREASISVRSGSKPNQQRKSSRKKIRIGHLHAGKTSVTYEDLSSLQLRLTLDEFGLTELQLDPDQTVRLNDLFAKGRDVELSMQDTRLLVTDFSIRENAPSFLSDVRVSSTGPHDTLQAQADRINFVPMLALSIEKKSPALQLLEVNNVNLLAFLHEGNSRRTSSGSGKPLSARIDEFRINNARINFKKKDKQSAMQMRTGSLDLKADGIVMGNGEDELAFKKASLRTDMFNVSLKDSLELRVDKGKFEIDLNSFRKQQGKGGNMSADIDRLITERLSVRSISRKGKAPLEIRDFNAGTEQLKLDSFTAPHILGKIKENRYTYAERINLSKVSDKNELYAWGLSIRNGGRLASVDSVSFRPAIDRDSFNRARTYQSDYMMLSTGKLVIHDLDLERIGKDSTYNIRFIEVNKPSFSVYKDKRLPFEHGIIKPLPTDLLQRIGVKFRVDSIRIREGEVVYEEWNDKTNSLATVPLGRVDARITNAANFGHNEKDSLYLSATAYLLNKVYFRVRFNESYTDTLSAFLFGLRVSGFDLREINSFLVPIANARIRSGKLDTLYLRAIGREYLSHGKMRMLYKDLNIEYLNKKDQAKRTFVTRMITGIANLIVRRDNLKTTGTVFAVRDRERGFVNYWLKIILGGALTNAGIKSNSKQEKKYKRSLKKIQVPEIPEVDL